MGSVGRAVQKTVAVATLPITAPFLAVVPAQTISDVSGGLLSKDQATMAKQASLGADVAVATVAGTLATGGALTAGLVGKTAILGASVGSGKLAGLQAAQQSAVTLDPGFGNVFRGITDLPKILSQNQNNSAIPTIDVTGYAIPFAQSSDVVDPSLKLQGQTRLDPSVYSGLDKTTYLMIAAGVAALILGITAIGKK